MSANNYHPSGTISYIVRCMLSSGGPYQGPTLILCWMSTTSEDGERSGTALIIDGESPVQVQQVQFKVWDTKWGIDVGTFSRTIVSSEVAHAAIDQLQPKTAGITAWWERVPQWVWDFTRAAEKIVGHSLGIPMFFGSPAPEYLNPMDPSESIRVHWPRGWSVYGLPTTSGRWRITRLSIPISSGQGVLRDLLRWRLVNGWTTTHRDGQVDKLNIDLSTAREGWSLGMLCMSASFRSALLHWMEDWSPYTAPLKVRRTLSTGVWRRSGILLGRTSRLFLCSRIISQNRHLGLFRLAPLVTQEQGSHPNPTP